MDSCVFAQSVHWGGDSRCKTARFYRFFFLPFLPFVPLVMVVVAVTFEVTGDGTRAGITGTGSISARGVVGRRGELQHETLATSDDEVKQTRLTQG